MTLYLIGIGLNNGKDITLKGLEIIKKCAAVYMENYTSKLDCPVSSLEKIYNKKIILAGRNLVEKKAENTILREAKEKNVAFLVIGDVFSATTHTDLFLRAKKSGIKVKIIHNASVLTAVGITGLELYKFGRVTSIPFDNKNIKTPVNVLKNNQKSGLHTLFLLDIDAEKNKFMDVKEGIDYLLRNNVKNQLAVVCAQLGSDKPLIKTGKLNQLKNKKINKFPQCLIIPAKLHFMEEEVLDLYS